MTVGQAIDKDRRPGLPIWERVALNAAARAAMTLMTKERSLAILRSTSKQLIAIAEHAGPEDAFEQVKVPRLIGIEHASRNWSVMMVIEHLTIVNRDILKLIGALQEDVTPKGQIDIADYKPEADLGWDTIDTHQATLAQFDAVANATASLQSVAYFRHPWFGMFNAHQWLCMAALHQRIHLRQAQRIVAILGVS